MGGENWLGFGYYDETFERWLVLFWILLSIKSSKESTFKCISRFISRERGI
jgi:hypothetical protein